MLDLYKIYCEKSTDMSKKQGFDIIYGMYICDTPKTVAKLAIEKNVSERQIYRYHDSAVETLSALMFGIDALDTL